MNGNLAMGISIPILYMLKFLDLAVVFFAGEWRKI
jgi:hypothetical protein